MTTPVQATRKLAEVFSVDGAITREGFNPVAVGKAVQQGGLHVAKGGGQLYAYDSGSGVYKPASEVLRRLLVEFLDDDWRPARADAVLTYLYDVAPRLWEKPPLDRINVRNGILNVFNHELDEHSPEWLSPIQIGAAWDADADCPAIRRFLEDVFPADVVKLGYEIAGLCSVPDYSFQKAILLVGSGANGKSVFLSLVGYLLGADNVTHVSLHELASNRFAAAELYGKLANICGDLPSRQVSSVDTFKKIVGGDPINGERKYGRPFTFRPFARLAFSANEIPGSRDTSYAYLRRWIVIPFPNRFADGDADPDLLEKLVSPDELAGFLRLSLLAYRDLLGRRSFTTGASTEEAAQEFKEAIDPVATFISERTVAAPDREIDRTVAYQEYKQWSESAGRPALSARKFYARAVQHAPELLVTRKGGRDIWVGIDVSF